jgi:hypothetical protein
LAPAQLKFGWEPAGEVVEELLPLAKRHAQEVGQGDIDPYLPWFFAQARAGILRIWTARRGDVLVGYILFLVSPNPWKQAEIMAVADGFWLAPTERFGWNGIQFVKKAEEALKKFHVLKVDFSPLVDFCNDNGYTADLIFKRLGYRMTERRWSKRL